MPIEDFVEKEFISARFILAILVIAGFVLGKVDMEIAGLILAFYFGSNPVTKAAKQAMGIKAGTKNCIKNRK